MIDMAERQVRPLLKFMDRVIPKVFNNPKHLFLLTTPRDFLFDGVFLQCQSNDIVIRVACAIIEKLAPRTIVRQTDGNFKFSLFNYVSFLLLITRPDLSLYILKISQEFIRYILFFVF